MSDTPDLPREGMAWPRDPDAEEPDDAAEVAPPPDEESSRQLQEALEQRPPHVSRPQPEAATSSDTTSDDGEDQPATLYRGPRLETTGFDPLFGLMVVGAISIGLLPVEANVRYVVLWILLGGLGVLGYLQDARPDLADIQPDDLRVGLGLGVAIGAPVMILMGGPMAAVSARMFDVADVPPRIMDTWVLMAALFVMPAVETLFFRGVLQAVYPLPVAALLATAWSMLMFYPHMSLGNTPGVAASIGLFFGLLHFLYSYVRLRNGIAAAWGCQVIASGLIWFMPRLLF